MGWGGERGVGKGSERRKWKDCRITGISFIFWESRFYATSVSLGIPCCWEQAGGLLALDSLFLAEDGERQSVVCRESL